MHAVITNDTRQEWLAVLPQQQAVALAAHCRATAYPVQLCVNGLHYERITGPACPCTHA
jgi:hypothetical protein